MRLDHRGCAITRTITTGMAKPECGSRKMSHGPGLGVRTNNVHRAAGDSLAPHRPMQTAAYDVSPAIFQSRAHFGEAGPGVPRAALRDGGRRAETFRGCICFPGICGISVANQPYSTK